MLANQCQNAAAGDGDARSAARIKAMLLYIESHYSERISIDTLAREALLSQSEALRCFHTVLNTTPSKYIQQYRLEKAAALLKKSDLTTTEIAMECGFQSSSYFIKTFRAYTGFAPRAYRKAHISCAGPSPIL